jgi:hypothetical protein
MGVRRTFGKGNDAMKAMASALNAEIASHKEKP